MACSSQLTGAGLEPQVLWQAQVLLLLLFQVSKVTGPDPEAQEL